MIFNQVLEQFGDWILFWKELKSWFWVQELDMDFFVNFFYNRSLFMDHYERKKALLETLLGDIGYVDVHLTSQFTDRESLIAALVQADLPQMDLSSYRGSYPEFIELVEHYYRNRRIIEPLAGEDFVAVISSVEENQDRDWKLIRSQLSNKLDLYMRSLLEDDSIAVGRILRNLFNLYADVYRTREMERDFDLFNRLPLPRNDQELAKIGKLLMTSNLTNDQMDDVGVFRTDKEKMAFFVQENRRALKVYPPCVTWMFPKEYIQQQQYCAKRCYSHAEAFFMTDSHRFRAWPSIRKEDPQLTFSFESLIECELLKKEFVHSLKFFSEMNDFFKLENFPFTTLREDLVEEFSKRLDEYLIALHRHSIGSWLIAQVENERYESIEGVTIFKVTQFTYYLFVSFFSILFLFVSRKVFLGGWWQMNVKIVSFIFNLMKEQSNIRAIVHLPLLLTVFIFILLNNLIGLLPFGYTITSHILFTFFFGFSLLIGITILIWKEKGKEMIQLFLPKGVPSFLVPFLFVIEVISYLFRTVSLSVRLFANMMAGHALLHILSNFGVVISSLSSPLRFFFIFPIVVVCLITFLEVGIAILQAYVFTVLLAIYFNDVYSLEGH